MRKKVFIQLGSSRMLLPSMNSEVYAAGESNKQVVRVSAGLRFSIG